MVRQRPVQRAIRSGWAGKNVPGASAGPLRNGYGDDWAKRNSPVRTNCAILGLHPINEPTGGGDPPRKPLPRKKIPADLRSLARGHSALCIRTLAGIAGQEAMPPGARVTAAVALLDRGWGRPAQSPTRED